MSYSKQVLLENTNRLLLSWVAQERGQKRSIPLAIFKSKAIRIFRDLKTQMDVDYDGQLKADRKWFMRFLNRHPVRYDNVAETMVTLAETKGGGMSPRFIIRPADMQFIFDDSGGESSEDDDVIIIEDDLPPPPQAQPQQQQPQVIKTVVTPARVVQQVPTSVTRTPQPVASVPVHVPVPSPAPAPVPGPSQESTPRLRRKVVMKSTAKQARQIPTPVVALSRLSRKATQATPPPPPPAPAKKIGRGRKSQSQVVPPLKIKLPPGRPVTPEQKPVVAHAAAAAAAPPRQKRVKMVTRCVQVRILLTIDLKV